MPRASIFTVAPYGTSYNELGATVQEILDLLSDAGFVQTSDTGQLTSASVGAANVITGYTVHRFDDPLQSISPVFFKLYYGYNNGVDRLRVNIQIGTGSDGAGNLTGLTSGNYNMSNVNWAGVLTAQRSIATHSNGFGACVYRPFSANSPYVAPIAFAIMRSVDNNGVATGDSVTLVATNGGSRPNISTVHRIRYSPTPLIYASSAADLSWIPTSLTSSFVGGVPQVFLTWEHTPKLRPLAGMGVAVQGETGLFDEFPLALVGVAERNYISVGYAFGASAIRNTALGSAQVATDTLLLWED